VAEATRPDSAPERPPTDVRTFLIADVRGYTRFTQERGDEAASVLAARFAHVVRDVVPEYDGELLELRGDEALCVFGSARQALRAAVALQRRLRTPDGDLSFPLGVGIGLDSGEAVPTEGGYRGGALNLAARLCATATGGEILATETVVALSRRVDGIRFAQGRTLRFKGIDAPVRVIQVVPEIPFPALPQATRTRARWQWASLAALLVVVAVVLAVALVVSSRRSSQALVVPGNRVAVFGSDGHLTETINLQRAQPTGLAVLGDSIWVSVGAQGRVFYERLHPLEFSPITVGSQPAGIAASPSGVWVANSGDGTVSEINPSVPQTEAAPIFVGNGPDGVVVARRAVWVTLSVDGTVAKIDPAKGRVVKRIEVGADPTSITYGSGRLWVTNESAGTVTPVDLSTGAPDTPIPVGSGPTGITANAGSVWVTNSLDDTVTKIRASDGRVVWTRSAGGHDPRAIAFRDGTLWIACQGSGALTRLAASTGDVKGSTTLGSDPSGVWATASGTLAATVPPPAGHRGGTLTIATWPLNPLGYPVSIDPQSGWAYQSEVWNLLAMTNDGLVGFKRVGGPDGENVVADLAEALPVVGDGDRTYTFTMRCCVRYSTGQLVKPADIRYALERTFELNPTAPGGVVLPPASYYQDIEGASRCIATPRTCDLAQGISVTGSAITFHLTRPDPEFLDKLALPFADAVPQSITPHDVMHTPVPATGPYRVRTFGDHGATLVRNQEFHEWSADAQPAGFPNRIVYKVIGNQTDTRSAVQRVRAVENGSADLLWTSPPPSTIRTLETTYLTSLHPSALAEVSVVVLNASRPPFNSPLARRAFSLALDRGHMVSLGGSPNARPTCQFLPPNTPSYQPYCPLYKGGDPSATPDLRQAQRLVSASHTRGDLIRIWAASSAPPFPVETAYARNLLTRLGYKVRLDTKGGSNDNIEPPRGEAIDYPSAGALFEFMFGATPAIRRVEALEATDPLRAAQDWTRLDQQFTKTIPVAQGKVALVPIWTNLAAGFTARRVADYLFSQAPGSTPIIDQLWVR
jgi:ABC-type transport system substrate-binding protein/class 3 adenylate cyclase